MKAGLTQRVWVMAFLMAIASFSTALQAHRAIASEKKRLSVPHSLLKDGIRFKLLGDLKKRALVWSKVPGAQMYEVVLCIFNPSLEKWEEIHRETTSETLFPLAYLGVGYYAWTVSALKQQRQASPFLPRHTFSIEFDSGSFPRK